MDSHYRTFVTQVFREKDRGRETEIIRNNNLNSGDHSISIIPNDRMLQRDSTFLSVIRSSHVTAECEPNMLRYMEHPE